SQLKGDGIQGDGTLEGNEEALETFYQDVHINQLRHAVRSEGKMSEQRVPFSVRDEDRDGLADWWSERSDNWFLNQICGTTSVAAPDADHVTYAASGSSSEADISASTVSHFSLKWIDTAVEKAKLAKNALRPLNIGGRKKYVAFIHPYQVTSLRTSAGDSQWQ